LEWWTKVAEQGMVAAQSNLGVCYFKGNGTKRDNNEAVKWLSKAAEQGDKIAKKELKQLGTN